jgi:hypothetical protein
MPVEREDLQLVFNPLDNKVDRILDHLERLNSKTEKNSIDIAVLKTVQEQTKSSTRNHSMGWGAGAGTFVGGIIIAVYQFFSK